MRFVLKMLSALAIMCTPYAFAANVAIVSGSYVAPDLASGLTTAGNTVTLLTAPYTAASLAAYDMVIQDGNPFFEGDDDATAAAFTELMLYVQNGGHLLLVPWAGSNYPIPTVLRSIANGGTCTVSDMLSPGITVIAPADPLLAGATVPTAAGSFHMGRICSVTFTSGATKLLRWADGTAMLGYRAYGSGVVTQLNMHITTNDTAYQVINQPWALQLVINAIAVAAPVPPPPDAPTLAVAVPLDGAIVAALLLLLAGLGSAKCAFAEAAAFRGRRRAPHGA